MMPSRIDDLLADIAARERELEAELNRASERWHYRIRAGRVRFDRDVQIVHQRLKQSIPRFLLESSPLNVLVAPVIYSLIVPVAILDLWVSLYQWICFPAYKMAYVRRSTFIVIDRQHLAYLNAVEKVNCMFCGYANGVFAYAREVGARTEQYWCPIRHAKRLHAPHTHYRQFIDYGDAEGYRRRLIPLRNEMKPPEH